MSENKTRVIKPSDGEVRGGGGYKQPSYNPNTNRIANTPPPKK